MFYFISEININVKSVVFVAVDVSRVSCVCSEVNSYRRRELSFRDARGGEF